MLCWDICAEPLFLVIGLLESGLMRALSCCCPEHEQLMSAALMGLGQPSGAVKADVGW